MAVRIPRFIAAGLAAAALTAAVGGAAFAQTTPGQTPVPIQQRAEEFINSFAAKLGKTPAEVKAASIAVQKERVAADVAAGRLTQAQADAINARIDQSGGLGLFGKGGHHGGPKGGPGEMRGILGAELATFLGIQPQELMTALQSGKSLATYAQEKGKSRDELKAYLTTQERTKLATAVTAGRLTQAQADEHLARFTSGLDQMIDRVGPIGGPGRGLRRGGFPGGPGQASATPALGTGA